MMMNSILIMKQLLFYRVTTYHHDGLDFPFTCKARNVLSKLKINKVDSNESISNEMLEYGSSVVTIENLECVLNFYHI